MCKSRLFNSICKKGRFTRFLQHLRPNGQALRVLSAGGVRTVELQVGIQYSHGSVWLRLCSPQLYYARKSALPQRSQHALIHKDKNISLGSMYIYYRSPNRSWTRSEWPLGVTGHMGTCRVNLRISLADPSQRLGSARLGCRLGPIPYA
jgi:hypothetical protein